MKRSPVFVSFAVLFFVFIFVALSSSNPSVQAQDDIPSLDVSTTVELLPIGRQFDPYKPEDVVITPYIDGFMVTWSTRLPTSTDILYGPSLNEMTSSKNDPRTRGTAHRISVRGLNMYEVYYFVIVTSEGHYGTNGGPFKLITDPNMNVSIPTETIGRLSESDPAPFVAEVASITENEINTEPVAAELDATTRQPPLSANAILADGQFVNGPNVDGFDTAVYVEQNMPNFAPHIKEIEQVAAVYSINPRVLLTLIELGLLTSNDLDLGASENVGTPAETDFAKQLDGIAVAMLDAYYQHINTISPLALEERSIAPVLLRDGIPMSVAPNTNAGSYAILNAIGLRADPNEFWTLTSPIDEAGFLQTYLRLFPDDDPLSQENQILIGGSTSAVPPVWLFQLPYPTGQAWTFNGAHRPNGTISTPFASIDFWSSERTVVAATSGTFTRSPSWSTCQVEVRHSSGWSASYYHLESIPSYLANGTTIMRNGRIGFLADTIGEATCHGGSWSFPHVHFTLKYNGQFQDVDGASLARWTVHRGTTNYACNGFYFEKGSTRRYCPDSRLLNHPDNDNYTIVNGQTYQTNISPNYDSDRFSFNGQQGQRVQIWMTRNDTGSLDSYLRLYGSDDVLISYNDDSDGLNSYIDITLPKTDTYQIIATSFGNGSTGAYLLKFQQSYSTCTPNSNQVAVYVDANYSGQCVVRDIGVYPNPGAIGLPNDSISSVKVGGNVRLRLYEHDNYQGRTSSLTSNDPNLGDNTIGNDSVSSMRVENRTSNNMALNRPAWATSYESSSTPAFLGNDGNTGTRWSSRHSPTSTTEWWRVDLGSVQTFDKVNIRWETAYASNYFVGWSDNGINFTGYYYSPSAPGYYAHLVGTRSARYVAVMMVQHAPCCANYSLWEFEVFRNNPLNREMLQLPNGLDSAEITLPIGDLESIQMLPSE